MTDSADGICRGAKAVAASSWVKTVSSMRQCCRSFGPPWTMRWPIAAGCILASLRSLPIRTTASRWPGMEPVSENNTFPPASSAWNLPPSLPIDSASPETSLSIPADPTRYNPNLSEEEPLFSASTCNGDSASIMRIPRQTTRLQGPAPIADFRHVVAVLADIELMALHGRPVTRGRLVELIAEAWNTTDGIPPQLNG